MPFSVKDNASFHIIEFLFKNEEKIINFCSLNRSNCNTNFDQQVLEGFKDKNCQYVLSRGGLLARSHEKWNAFIPMMFHRCFTCVLSVILTGEHNKKTIQVSSIKGTHVYLIDFIAVYLTDFCVLVYVSSNSGKTIDECNAMIQSMNSKITNDTWHEEDLGETTDSHIFFCCVSRKTKIERKKNIKLMKIYVAFLSLFFMRMLRTIFDSNSFNCITF